MKTAIGALVAMSMITPAVACNADMLSVTQWQVVKNEGSLLPYLLSAEVTYKGARKYRMIHAGVMFSDVLGQSLGQVNLTTDQLVSPGDTVTADGQVQVDKRMAEINRDDIVYRTCVWSIVYDDGTVEKFG